MPDEPDVIAGILQESVKTTVKDARRRQEVINSGRERLNEHLIFVSTEIVNQTNNEQAHNHKHRSWVVGIVTFILLLTLFVFIWFVLIGVAPGYNGGVFTLLLGEGFSLYKIIANFYFSNYLTTDNYNFVERLLKAFNEIHNTFDKDDEME